MARVILDDGEALAVCDFGDGISKIPVKDARFAHGDGSGEAVEGDADETAARLVDGAHAESLVHVAVEALVENGDIEIDDVAVLERPRVGYAVADDFINGYAD